ncbi:MAG: hypothetical protein M1836_002281 [Candelina mexicana]|nr:MAG: hypothetical protein M1836_002281 [Candelina mexicana]
MGSTEDPENGKAVAGSIFTAVAIYGSSAVCKHTFTCGKVEGQSPYHSPPIPSLECLEGMR